MERRKRRSERRSEAIGLYLAALREEQQLQAVSLATEEGLLVAGSGAVDLERMAAVAASCAHRSARWTEGTLHVQRFEAFGAPLYLASAGKAVKGNAPLQRIARILAS